MVCHLDPPLLSTVGSMKSLAWLLYGIGLIPVVGSLTLDSSLTIGMKSLLVAGSLFVGAIIAAIERPSMSGVADDATVAETNQTSRKR